MTTIPFYDRRHANVWTPHRWVAYFQAPRYPLAGCCARYERQLDNLAWHVQARSYHTPALCFSYGGTTVD
jgi:hypothetical protein